MVVNLLPYYTKHVTIKLIYTMQNSFNKLSKEYLMLSIPN